MPIEQLSPQARQAVADLGDRVMRYTPKNGAVVWEQAAWESIRSDSHQITVKCAASLWMTGSPARVIGDGCSVFSAGASAALDLLGCVDVMRRYVAKHIGHDLPPAEQWLVSRVDVTGNYELSSLEEVRQALTILRNCEGGRYRVSQQAGDTVYWSHLSKLRSGKAYAKGPHLVYLQKQKTFTGTQHPIADIEHANRLLRLELKLGREYWNRNDWKKADAKQLTVEWENYFTRMIGGAEMKIDENIRARLEAVSKTKGRAHAAYGCWLLIQSEGWERAKTCFPQTTWNRHLRMLRAAGLSDADLSAGRVVQLRRKVLEARIVNTWEELRRAA